MIREKLHFFRKKVQKIRYQKNCLNCTFCVRNRHTWISSSISQLSRWNYDIESLTLEERERMRIGDDSFIGEQIRSRGWQEANNLGMSERPCAPNYDFISCFEKGWSENRDRNEKKDLRFLIKHKCPFYFSYKKKGYKTLETCQKQRDHNKESFRFLITNFFFLFKQSFIRKIST